MTSTHHGLQQRLGTLTLKHKPEQGIELYDWCVDAIASREALKAQLASANSKAAELETAVSELKGQLQALTKARGDDEEHLIEGFQAILNEKKVKIRQQQRIIASANVATVEADAPESESEPEPETKPAKKGARAAKKSAPARAAGPSRRGKRKVEVSEDEDSDDGFEKMDVDTKEAVPLDEDQMTTEAEETASDTDDDEEAAPPTRQRAKNGAGQSKIADVDMEAPPSQNTRHKADEKAPPPPRRLPFTLGKPADNKPGPAFAAGADSETESDDEL